MRIQTYAWECTLRVLWLENITTEPHAQDISADILRVWLSGYIADILRVWLSGYILQQLCIECVFVAFLSFSLSILVSLSLSPFPLFSFSSILSS
jgi:hypothetical protein